jgi:hypothetical protein
MNPAIEQTLRVLEACNQLLKDDRKLISIAWTLPNGKRGQVFLEWVAGKPLRDYIRERCFEGHLSIYQATYGSIRDHRDVQRRLVYVPQPGDELRIKAPSSRRSRA